eukprot:jgi/Astpho2/4630/Aster-00203
MAVDLGSEFLKVSVVKSGKIPIATVLNEASKRKTAAEVAFINGDRLIGDDAAALGTKYPEKVISRARDLLGKPAADSCLQRLLKQSQLSYEVVAEPERGTASVRVDSGDSLTAEELVGSLLHYARTITSSFVEGAQILDCVIAVPAFWGQAQRQAMTDAAGLAGLNVLSLINSHAAAALQFGIERDFTDKVENVVLYDMGANSVEVALVKYSSFTVKEAGKPKTYSQFEVKDVTWDVDLGAQQLDLLLMDHFVAQFEAQHPDLKVRDSPRALAKLKKQVKRTKEILSANTEAPLSVEELLGGHDFRSSISRTEFERLAGKPAAAFWRNNLTKGDIAAVELLGGGSRVPKVKAALSEALDGRGLDKHLDADEAVVLGAALYAANLSTTFRLRKCGMTDGVTHPVTYQLDDSTQVADGEDGTEAMATAFKPKALLPFLKKVPTKRVVHLPNITTDPIRFRLFYDTDSGVPLPPSTAKATLGTFEATGLESVLSKWNETGKINVHLKADSSGLISVDKAECVLDLTEQVSMGPDITVEVEVPVKDNNDTADRPEGKLPPGQPGTDEQVSAGAGDKSEDESSEASFDDSSQADVSSVKADSNTTGPMRTEKALKNRKKTFRIPLALSGAWSQPGLTAKQKQASATVLNKLKEREEAKHKAAMLKNELESYIISIRSKVLDEDDAVQQVTTPKQRNEFLAALTAAEDWLYDQGEDEQASVFREKLDALKETGDAAVFRASESTARPEAVELAQQFLELTRKSINSWPQIKPWINGTDSDSLLKQVDELEKWLDKEVQRQGKVKAHQAPVLHASAITAKVAELRQAFDKLNRKKKPAPPAVPKANATANGTEGANITAGAGEDDPAADDSADQDAGDTPHASAKAEDSSGSFKGKGKGAKGKGAKGKGAKGPGKGPKGRGDKAGRTKRGRDAANLNKLKNDFPGLNIMDFENMDMDALKTQLDEMQAARDQGDQRHEEL